MTVKIFEEIDKKEWNEFVCRCTVTDFMQLWQWGDYKKKEGFRVFRVAVVEANKLLLTAQFFVKNIPYLGNYLFIPSGPVFDSVSSLKHALPILKDFLTDFAKKNEVFLIELEPKNAEIPEELFTSPIVEKNLQVLIEPAVLNVFEKNGFRLSGKATRKKDRFVMDLASTDIANPYFLKKIARSKIKEASNSEVYSFKTVAFEDGEFLDIVENFLDLMHQNKQVSDVQKETEKRKIINIFKAFAGTDHIQFSVATKAGNVVGLAIIINTAVWSSILYSIINPTQCSIDLAYLLRYKTLQFAKDRAAKIYDFGSVTYSGWKSKFMEDKAAFNPSRLRFIGMLNLVSSPSRAFIWNNTPQLRKKILGI